MWSLANRDAKQSRSKAIPVALQNRWVGRRSGTEEDGLRSELKAPRALLGFIPELRDSRIKHKRQTHSEIPFIGPLSLPCHFHTMSLSPFLKAVVGRRSVYKIANRKKGQVSTRKWHYGLQCCYYDRGQVTRALAKI